MQSNRQRFIKTSATAATSDKKFELKILATNRGLNGSVDDYCAKVKKEGYDGIEIWRPMQQAGQDELFNTLKKYNIAVRFCAEERLTIQTKFDPPDYMPVMPYTRQALSDQWAINAYIMHLLR